MRVAILGSGGQLGSDLRAALAKTASCEVVALPHEKIEVTDPKSVQSALAAAHPDVVVNCAAFHQVDQCADRPDEAYRVNALGARYVAEACDALNAACVYISTDYVFDGEKASPYLEEDSAIPVSVYGASKLAGEHLVRISLEKHYIVRCSGLFGVTGASGKGGNFINTMLRLAREERDIKVVDDQRFSPTSTEALAEKIAWLATTGDYGTWHITCRGECTWYELAGAVFELAGLQPKLSPTNAEAFGAKARRPAYSVLGHGRLNQAGADDLPHWRDAVEQYLRATGEISGASQS